MTSQEHVYFLLDVFAKTAFEGNPLAVFCDARTINQDKLQKIANELNLSETVFLYPTDDKNIYNARIFTPSNEIPFAGHPSIGSAYALLSDTSGQGAITLNMPAGVVNVLQENDLYFLTPPQTPERLPHPFKVLDFAEMLSIDVLDISDVHNFSAGLPFLCIEVKTKATVDNADLSLQKWSDTLSDFAVKDIYIFHLDTDGTTPQIYCRCFAPADNIPEDPATGSAASALCGLLIERGIKGQATFKQGVKMGRPSEIIVKISNQNEIMVGGNVIKVGKGCIYT